jgi:hypothetical protein
MSTGDENRRTKRATIVISTDEHSVVSQAIRALRDVENVFQRRGSLVRIRCNETQPHSAIRESARIEVIPSAALRELLSEHARLIAVNESGKEIDRHVPSWLVQELEARASSPGIRELHGVIHEPCLRRDGSVLDEPGYDERTRLLYLPCSGRVTIDQFPTRDDALVSIENLLEIVRDFPFVDEGHRTAWLAALLTPFARFAFSEARAPLFMIDANSPGTGKSTLADVVGLIATGHPMPRNVYPQSDDELRKLITSLVLAGMRITLFDNVSGALGSASLDAALTGSTWCDRVLGRNAITEPLPLFTVWFATGNNLMLNGDTHRRTLQIRLESDDERPEERSHFAHPNLRRWVTDKRESFVRDALTVLRAYHAAGRPVVTMEPWGSFDEWSKHVRAPLIWCGLPDPAVTRRSLAGAVDHERELLGHALAAIAELDVHGVGLTVGGILERLALPANQARRSTLAQWVGTVDSQGLPHSRSLGMKLANSRKRVVSGLQLERSGERWIVRRVTAGGSAGSTGSRSGGSASSPDQEDP